MSITARIRVMMLVDSLSERSGGAERLAVGLATHLPADRFETSLCATRHAEGRLLDALRDAGVECHVLGRSGKADVHRLLALGGLLRSRRVDVLHAHKFGSNAWGTLFGAACRVPVVLAHEHTWSYEGRPLRKLLDGRLIGRLATGLVAVSEADRHRMITLERVPAGKVRVMPNAYVPSGSSPAATPDLRDELGLAAGTPLIGTAAMLRPQKALEVLLEAHSTVLARHPAAVLAVAGAGDQMAALAARAQALGLGQSVRFLGPRGDVDAIIRSLDVAAISSDYEGSPLFMYECMANMTPLVSTDVGNIGEILSHPDAVWLVPRRNPEALGAAICALLEDPDRRAAIASRAHARLAGHRIEAVAGRFGTLYEELLQSRTASGSGRGDVPRCSS